MRPSGRSVALLSALTLTFATTACADGKSTAGQVHLTPAQRAKCALRGSPITLGRLVRVFRAHGVSLSIKEPTCFKSEKQRNASALIDASTFGPSGLVISKTVRREAGDVLCSVALKAPVGAGSVHVSKYSTDTETSVYVWNVDCAVYPSDQASEKRQVERARRAMVALAATVKTR